MNASEMTLDTDQACEGSREPSALVWLTNQILNAQRVQVLEQCPVSAKRVVFEGADE